MFIWIGGLVARFYHAKVKWNPYIALLLASVILGIITGMDIRDVADAVQTGVGNTLGNVGRGFGAVFGEDSTWNDWIDSLENRSLRLMGSFFTLGCARGFNKGEQKPIHVRCLHHLDYWSGRCI
ncbi:hypothetical protein RCO48_12120 [Peribacillus frigoritolerans]|nr:hypothetical protein [Peribacillus frigoritolerans]